MEHLNQSLTVTTPGKGFYPLGGKLNRILATMGAEEGLLHVFLTHTSASLCIQENADPDVLLDLADALARIAPEGRGYRHNSEGADDMPAHIKTAITATSLSIPVRGGRLALGVWQEVYLVEHRESPHSRKLELDFLGRAGAQA